MKNIIIAVLSVLLLLSTLYGYVQQGIAREQEKIAVMNAQQAEQNLAEAKRQQALAEQQAIEAMAAREKAEQAIQDCLKKKK